MLFYFCFYPYPPALTFDDIRIYLFIRVVLFIIKIYTGRTWLSCQNHRTIAFNTSRRVNAHNLGVVLTFTRGVGSIFVSLYIYTQYLYIRHLFT